MTLQVISESTIDTIVSTLRLNFEYHIVKIEYHLYSMHARHKVDDIVEKMKRIVKFVKAHAMKINKRMIARANANRKLIEYEIKNHVWLNRRNIKIVKLFDKLDDKHLKLYLIIKKENQIYELKFLDIMHIHSIFHFWLFRKDSQNSLLEQINEFLESIILKKISSDQWTI